MKKRLKVAITTLGCKANQYDSSAIEEALGDGGCKLVNFAARADAYIINTCTVTSKTDYQSRQLIRRARIDQTADLAHICTTLETGFQKPHDLAHIFG